MECTNVKKLIKKIFEINCDCVSISDENEICWIWECIDLETQSSCLKFYYWTKNFVSTS